MKFIALVYLRVAIRNVQCELKQGLHNVMKIDLTD